MPNNFVYRALTLVSVRFRTKTLVTRLHFFKEHKNGLNAASFLNLLCALPLLHVVSPNGGASQDRTDDPLLAKQVLSQLSYGPK